MAEAASPTRDDEFARQLDQPGGEVFKKIASDDPGRFGPLAEKINSVRRRPGYCLGFGGRSNPAKRSCTVTSLPPNIVAFSWSIARALSLTEP